MKVIEVSSPPFHPVYELVCRNEEINEVIDWLAHTKLPNCMSLSLGCSIYKFRTKEERISFALGLQATTGNWKNKEL